MLLLGRADRIVPPYLRGFLVYLHQRGQVWVLTTNPALSPSNCGVEFPGLH